MSDEKVKTEEYIAGNDGMDDLPSVLVLVLALALALTLTSALTLLLYFLLQCPTAIDLV
jgi:hypothetical protein